MNRLSKLWSGSSAILLAGFALGAGFIGCRPTDKPGDPPGPEIFAYRIVFPTNAPQLSYLTVEPVQESPIAATGLYGRLAWDDNVTARIYSPVAGRVMRIPVELNRPVSAGDALALLDSPDFGQALADARTARGNLTAADKAYSRAKELLAHGAAAQKEVEAAEAAFIAARAENERAGARLANFGGTPGNTNHLFVLRSPLNGVVVEKNISTGQEIRADLMLANAQQFINPQFVVTDPSRLWLFLDLDETAAAALTPGREISIHARAYPGRIFRGELEIIGHELDPATRTVRTRCRVDNSEQLLRAEMYVTADAAVSTASALNVPTKAVFLKDDKHFVFIEIAPGRFERRAVEPGAEGGGRTTVLNGLQPGQRVVTDGCLLLESLIEGAAS
jgi:cobalt-zinc-cadmium efflux system membrane fusion protein